MEEAITSDLLTDITTLATAVFRATPKANEVEAERLSSSPFFIQYHSQIPIAAATSAYVNSDIRRLVDKTVEQIIADRELSVLATDKGLGPTVFHAGGGRTSAAWVCDRCRRHDYARGKM